MPLNLETFSAKGIEIENNIDFSDCHSLTFLLCKQADFIFGSTDQLSYIKVGNTEALRGDKIK